MSPAHVLEPTYEALRRRLLTGAWPAGYRLEAALLAHDIGVSITPVRDSLNRLTGERLVAAIAGEGFYVPRIDEAGLRDLLDWHQQIVLAALDRADRFSLTIDSVTPDFADRSASLFSQIVRQAHNREMDWTIENAAMRLHRFRMHEQELLPEAPQDLLMIEQTAALGPPKRLRELVRSYHDNRRRLVDRLVASTRASR